MELKLTSSVFSPGHGCGSADPPGEAWCPAALPSFSGTSSSAAAQSAAHPHYLSAGQPAAARKHKHTHKHKHKHKHAGLLLHFNYQNIYFILFPIKTLAAIFNKTANGQVPQSSSSNPIFSSRSHGSVGVSLAFLLQCEELAGLCSHGNLSHPVTSLRLLVWAESGVVPVNRLHVGFFMEVLYCIVYWRPAEGGSTPVYSLFLKNTAKSVCIYI